MRRDDAGAEAMLASREPTKPELGFGSSRLTSGPAQIVYELKADFKVASSHIMSVIPEKPRVRAYRRYRVCHALRRDDAAATMAPGSELRAPTKKPLN